jgi:hypothetical protein
MVIKENLLALMKDKLTDLPSYSYNKRQSAYKEIIGKYNLEEDEDESNDISEYERK